MGNHDCTRDQSLALLIVHFQVYAISDFIYVDMVREVRGFEGSIVGTYNHQV